MSMLAPELLPAVLPFACLVALHMIGYVVARTVGAALSKLPHIVGHFAATVVGFAALAAFGVHGCFLQRRESIDHLSGYSESGMRIAQLMIGFQVYELLACAVARGEERARLVGPSGIMLVHHLTVVALASFVAVHHYMLFYADFFFGVPEISSVPLAFMDLFKAFPHLQQRHRAAYEAIRSVFAALFLLVRGVAFSAVSVSFWRDTLVALKLLEGEYRTDQPPWAVLCIGVGHLLMLWMQYFWAALIIRAVVHKLRGVSSHKEV